MTHQESSRAEFEAWAKTEESLMEEDDAWKGWCAARSTAAWRPIETAPKDGTRVLVNDTTPGYSPCTTAYWLQSDEWSGWMYDDELLLDSNPGGPNPTHWLPLPAPPRTTET